MLSGTVRRGQGGVYEVETPDGVLEAVLRGRLKRDERTGAKVVVGDRVDVEQELAGEEAVWAIVSVHERSTVLARRAPGKAPRPKPIVANVDQVLVVFAAANPDPHLRMLDRFLVIAEANALAARVVINKVELVGEQAARERFAAYERAGYPVHYTSAKADLGLAELHDTLAGRVSVLTGPSGVGKSSLVNALFPGVDLRVGEISESVNKGRHTTVGSHAHPLPDAAGGFLIDTPGLREVGMWSLPVQELDRYFPELRPHLEQCRFGDCAHDAEPDCAVRRAVESGEVSAERYDSYRRLRTELEDEPPVY